MAQTLVPGYPQSVGAKVEAVINVDGEVLYTTGGQTIDAKACGMTWIEYIGGAASSNGTYFTAGRCTGISKTQKLMWFVGSSGSEVSGVDLHASSVRIYVRGFL